MTIAAVNVLPHPARWRRLAAAWLLGFSGAAAVGAPDLIPVTMLAGFTPSAFLQGNRHDVELALKALAESVGRKRGYEVTVKTRFFPTPAAFRTAIEAGEINFAIFDSLTFVAEPRWGDLTPVFIPGTKGSTGHRYLLLTRRGSALRTLDDLRGKTLVELQTPDLNTGHAWLRSRLLAGGLTEPTGFFRSLAYVGKPATAVLPVFFGQRDVCLVDDLAFQLMTELNPQVGARLEVLETSPPLVGTIMCVSESNWSPRAFRPVLLAALGELQLDDAGRQILSLFKIDQLLPFEEARLAPVRALAAALSQISPEAKP